MKNPFKRKPRSVDFTAEGLPSSRPALFWDILKNEHRKLFGAALLLALFSLPFVALHIFTDFELLMLQKDDVSETWPYYIFLAILPISAAIYGIGLGGILRIIRRLCYLEPVFFWEDFKLGIKQNAKQCVFFCFFIGVSFSICYLGRISHSEDILWNIPFGIFALIAFPCLLFSFVPMATYSNSFMQNLSLSSRLYLKAFLTNIIPLALFLSPLFLEFIPDLAVKYIVFLLFSILIWPLLLLGFFLYQTFLLDKYINKEKFPALYDRGIHRKKKN